MKTGNVELKRAVSDIALLKKHGLATSADTATYGNCPTCGRPLCQQRQNLWPDHAAYNRFRRTSAALKGLCTACCKVPALPGKRRCAACQQIAYARKRKAAIINSRLCRCHKPAKRLLHGEYLCLECFKAHKEWQ